MSWRSRDDNVASSPDDFGALVAAMAPLGGEAAGVMHSRIGDTGPALEILQRHWSGPTLAYAETGRAKLPDWIFEDICPPDEYAHEVERWITSYGVQIVGGCCGTEPEHIRILKERLPQQLPG